MRPVRRIVTLRGNGHAPGETIREWGRVGPAHDRWRGRDHRRVAGSARAPSTCPTDPAADASPVALSHPLHTVRGMITRRSRRSRHSRRSRWAYDPERIVGLWWCPVCGGAAHRYATPGRPRVYCSNACRQRAYRSRRATRSEQVPSTAPLRRATTRERSHALREPDAIVGGRRDTSARAVTLCGAFARPAQSRPRGHVRFVSDVPWSCRSCAHLGGLIPAPP
jgi:hypothetical protein